MFSSSRVFLLLALFNAVLVSSYRWFNWEFDITCESTEYIVPANEAELAAFLKEQHPRGSFIKVVGNGHGLSNLTTCVDVSTTSRDSYIVSLENLRNISYGANNTVTFGGGWDLIDLIPELVAHGLQTFNLPSERVQNFIGGATPGSHGTGKQLGNLASEILAYRVLDAAGNVHVIDKATDPDAAKALQISLGALGIITELTLQAKPLQFVKRTTKIVQTASNLTQLYKDITQYAQELDRVNIVGPNFNWDSENLNWTISDTYTLMYFEPTNVTGVYNCSTDFCSNGCGNCNQDSFCYDLDPYAIAVPPSGVCSRAFMAQVEHFVPIEDLESAALDYTNLQLAQTSQIQNLSNNYLTSYEFRFVKGDDAFLSPVNTDLLGSENSGVFAAVELTYIGSFNDYNSLWTYQRLVRDFTTTLGPKYNSRPHWNKGSDFNWTYTEAVYPQVQKWLEYEEKFDPNCQFVNTFLLEHFNLTRCDGIVPTNGPNIVPWNI